LITPRFSSFSVVRFSQIAGRSIMTKIWLNLAGLYPIGKWMRNDAPPANVIAFHLGVQPNGEGDQTKEAGERCAESGTFPPQSYGDGQVVSMTVR
jgi:hypothetical protein